MKKNMKRSVKQRIGVLALCLLLGLAGCGASGSGNNKQEPAAAEAAKEKTAAADLPQEPATQITQEAQNAETAPVGDSGKLIPNDDMAGIGIHLNLPEAYENLKGMTELSGSDVSDGQGIYQGLALYAGITRMSLGLYPRMAPGFPFL